MSATVNDTPAAEAQETTARNSAPSGWKALIIQPVILALILAGMLFWLGNAQLTEVEKVTLDPASIWSLTLEHLKLTAISAVIVLALAIPLGVILTRKPFRKLTGFFMGLANVGQAAPMVGLIVLFAFWLGFGTNAALVTLVVYAFLPVLKNTMVGLDAVDHRLIEAARGMGMSAMQVLFKVELPLAVPVMLAGIRTALVLLVGSATLATFINGGGLGLLITTGVNLAQNRVLVFGSVLVAIFALAIDWLARVVEHIATPKGLTR